MKAILDTPVNHIWRNDPITDKQKKTIIKMQSILDCTCTVPDKKGAAADLIKELMAEAEKRIAVTGSMGYRSEYDDPGTYIDENGDNFFDNIDIFNDSD